MAIELYLMPMVTVVEPPFGNFNRAKYSRETGIIKSGTLRYSREDDAIVMLEGPQPVLDTIASNSDVTRLATESNIDQTLNTAQANAAKTIFENAFIPGQFINAGDTRREVIRGVIGMFLFSQRMEGRFGVGWRAKAQARGMTLNTQWNSFPQVLKDEFIDVRDSFGMVLDVTNTSTLREILREISNHFESSELNLNGFHI